jgi:Rrf2 family cysteine metabolism transcriptional repressor
MKMSMKCRYGLRALVDLALFSDQGHVALHEIAKRQDISLKYLEQDFSILRRAGIVKSVKGAQGGYHLSRPPSDISLSEIIAVLEGDTLLIDVDEPEQTDIRAFLVQHVWLEVNERVRDFLLSMHLSDLTDEYKEQQFGEGMFFI